MNAGGKLAAFSVVVAVAFGGAMAVGQAAGPIEVGDGERHIEPSVDATPSPPRGLSSADGGYRLVLDSTSAVAESASELGFEIVDDRGAAVSTFDELHERRLHLIVLSRNLVDYHHLHPVLGAGGRWSVELPALGPGSYRLFADFQPEGGANLTLATDLVVAGAIEDVALPEPNDVVTIGDYRVSVDGAPRVGDSELRFTVDVGGQHVTTEPYLGAAGHLVAIRTGDLAYLHVHPHDDDSSPAVAFTAEFPTAGTYRLFFEFAHAGVLRTAAYTLVVPDSATGSPDTAGSHDEGH